MTIQQRRAGGVGRRSKRTGLGQWTVGLFAVPGIPLVQKGDDIGALLVDAASKTGFRIEDRDVVVVAQKIVSKAEGAVVALRDVVPTSAALELAARTGRDARLCELYLRESSEILGTKGRMVITRHHLGFEGTSAGVDRSNVAPHEEAVVSLLPRDPDESARSIRRRIEELTGKSAAVIVSDTDGRADREGSFGVAIGVAGIAALEEREQQDLYGNPARPQIALVDELAAAASVIMGQADEALPVIVIRGVRYTPDGNASIRRLLIVS